MNAEPVNILIVDDQPENLRVLDKILTEQGYQVRKAINGMLALRSAVSNPPDVILLDIKMSEMDGYQVCEQLKANPQLKDIPVIFISALDETINKIRAFEVGGVDYVTKPFQAEEVMVRIKSQLTIQQQQKSLQLEIEYRRQKEKELQREVERRKDTEAILYQSRALINSVLNSALDGIAALQAVRKVTGEIADFRCLLVKPVMGEALGIKEEKIIGKLMLKRLLTKMKSDLFDSFVNLVETGKSLEQDIHYKYNNYNRWYHFIAVKLGDGFAITLRDITARKITELKLSKANQELDRLANVDGLTKVGNRRAFDNLLSQKWKIGLTKQKPLSLLLIDVDYFKYYNDFYGHLQGDDCLIKIAQAISKSVSRTEYLVARYGGEEFGIILPNTNIDGAVKLAELIRHNIQQLKIAHAKSKVSDYVTISLGVVSVIPTPDILPASLIAKADEALYQAKKQGRDRLISLSM